MKRILSMFLLLTLLCTLGMTQAFAEAEETTLIVAQSVDASTMDPQKQGGMSSMNVLINMFDTLVFRDSEGNLIPGLATEWEALDDLTWQFKLREGVTFHNGYPFTAEDVKFSLERLINPDTGSPIVELAALDHVDIVDDYTVNLVFKTPDPIVPNKLVMFGGVIISKQYTEEHDADYLATNPVGTGPFKFVSWTKDSQVVMEAYEDHWRGAPAYDNLIFRVVPNQADMLAALQTGEINMTNSIPYDLAVSVQNDPNISIASQKSIRVQFVNIDTAVEPLNDKRVRQALNYAVDKQAIIEAILGGHATQIPTLIPQENFGYVDTLEPYGYDPEKAKSLLAEAGYPDGFTVTFDALNTELTVIQAIVGYLEAVGVKVEMNVVDSSTLTSRCAAKEAANLYFQNNTGWTMDGMSNYQSYARTDRRYSRGGSEELNALVDIEETTIDPEVRMDAFEQAEALMYDEAYFIYLWQMDNLYATTADVEYTPNKIGLLWMFDAKPVE